MRVIQPLPITPIMLTSNVPETDAPAWVAGSYALGARVIRDYHVFESLADANTADPLADTTPAKWLDTGADNRWKMFDKGAAQQVGATTVQRQVFLIGTATTNPTSIDLTINPGAVVNAIALFGLTGYRVTVTMTDPVEGIVYQRVFNLIDPSASGMWEWLFKPADHREAVTALDLPAYGTASIRILIQADAGGMARCSMAVLGVVTDIGESVFGTGIGVTDFSRKEVDDFGNETVIERGFRDRVQYDVRIDTENVSFAKRFLTSLRAKPAVYIGDENREETIIFGRYRELQIVLSNPSISECALDVGALI